MEKNLDLRKILVKLYNPGKKPEIALVPAFNFLMLDGKGDPNTSPEYQATVEALFSLAYAIKFYCKKQAGIDFAVMPLEGLWWAEDMSTFSVENKDAWYWTMMIHQPELVSPDIVEKVRQDTLRKKGLPLLEQIRLETYSEGLSVQMMHIGPYSAEGPNIAWMHRFAAESGCGLHGKHHEIYLSDVRRTAPEKLKTILRQPILPTS